ncbi:universal stress protein [Fodinibius sediminis]|uniref:Nucleotide-binding universal stress protein, UspA family n=1 Tax=Fodinibius sediminis TaxID=1214077 RepID=A0A521CMJ0_9BACT|nr:universal stress protein [Fodinibius sediminis]SMO59900.1 Nucleotide-binding universal stress protein, UspA family [Fodinibius sediminis]
MALKLKNILFPTDFSINAQRALPFAAKIASLTGSTLILFHAIQVDLDFAPNFRQDQKKVTNKASQRFDTLIADLKRDDQYKDIEISRVLESEQPTAGILEISSEYKADLIVMGTKGATGDRNIIFGSVASSTINSSEVPVLAVPPDGGLDDLKHITFTTDYHEGDLNALKQTFDLAELFKSRVEVIYVAKQRSLLTEIKFRGFRDLVKDRSDYKNISFELKYDSDFFAVMADYFKDNPHSLLVMVRHKKAFWEKLVERNRTKEMAFYTKVPLLVLIGD